MFFKLKQKVYNILDWFNGFSFRFFLVIGGWAAALVFGTVALFSIFWITILWIFMGEDRSWKEFKQGKTLKVTQNK